MKLQKKKHLEIIDANQAAKILQVNPTTVRRWSHAGKIPAIKMPGGRLKYLRADIEALLEPAILNEDVESGGVSSSDMVLTPSEDVPLPGFTLA